MPTPNNQDDAVEAAFLAGTLPDEDRRAEDRRAPDIAPVSEADAGAEAEAAPQPEPVAPSKLSESAAPASVLCGHDGLPLPA